MLDFIERLNPSSLDERRGGSKPMSTLQTLTITMALPPRVHTYGIQVSADHMGLMMMMMHMMML